MASVTLKDFNGQNLKEGLWDQAYSLYNTGTDFYGLGDNPNLVSFPGVLQGAWPLSAMAISATTVSATSAGTLYGIIADFARYSQGGGTLYAIDSVSASHMYAFAQQGTTNGWQIQDGNQNSVPIAVSGVGTNLCEYNGNMYYTTSTYLGYHNGVTSNANYKALTNFNPHPMKVYAGSLFVANASTIDKYDGSTYQAAKLTLPTGYNIFSMETFRDYLYISASNGQSTKIFQWDGTSPTYNDTFAFPEEATAPTLCAAGTILWIIGNRGTAQGFSPTFTCPVYAFQYGLPEKVFDLPMSRPTGPGATAPMGGVSIYQGGVLIASTEVGATGTYEGGVAGLWYVNKKEPDGAYQAALMFIKTGALTNLRIGGIYSAGPPALYSTTQPAITIGVTDTSSGSTYQILGVTTTGAKATYYTLPTDAASTTRKNWISVRANFDALLTGQTVTILYRLDDATAFTTLKTFASTDPSTNRFARIPIGRTSRTITFQIQLATTGTNFTTRFHSMTIYYEPNEA